MIALKVRCPNCGHVFKTFRYDGTRCQECDYKFSPFHTLKTDDQILEVEGKDYEIKSKRREMIASR